MKRPLCAGCLVVVLFFALRIWLYPPQFVSFGSAAGGQVTLTGQVYAKEFQKGYDSPVLLLYIAPSALYFQNQEIPFDKNFICRMQADSLVPSIGSYVVVEGVLREFEPATNPGQFDARLYYATLGISARIDKAAVVWENKKAFSLREELWQFRCRLSEGLDAVFAADDAAVLKAMLLGDKSGLPVDLKENYKASGILHILAISGLHISVLGMGMHRALCKLRMPWKCCTVLCAIAMILYGVMVGMPVSAFRAVFMFLLRMFAEWKGRTYDMQTALAVGAVLLLIQQPLYLLHAGFLLSFSAVAAIVWLKPRLLPPLSERLGTKGTLFLKNLHHRLDAPVTSLAILFFTLPIQLLFYFEITVYAPVFNLLVLPFVGVLLAAGVGALSLWWLLPFLPFLTDVLALFAHWILKAYEQGAKVVSNLDGAIMTTGCPNVWQVICYVVLLCPVLFMKKLIWKYRIGLLCGAVFVLTISLHRGFSVTMLDVGQGQCICIRLPDGSTWLYDGGSLDVNGVGEYRIVPYLKSQGISTLDAVFLSHGDADHINGVTEMLLEGDIEIELLVLPVSEKDSVYAASSASGFTDLVLLADLRDVPILWLEAGMHWESAGVSVCCLHPAASGGERQANAGMQEIAAPATIVASGDNEDSMVLYLTYNDFSMLLTGDVEKSGEELLLSALQKEGIESVTVLQVAHHGSKFASSEDFLEQVSPRIALISCSAQNPYGHPHEEVLERLKEAGSTVLATSEYGAMEIVVDRNVRVRWWK